MVTARLQQVYRDQLNVLEDKAARYVESYMNALHAAAPDASVAQLREAAKEAIADALNAFGDQAAALACGLFDGICEAEGINAQARIYDVVEPELVDEKVRWLAGKLVQGELPSFVKDVTDLSRFYVKRSAFDNMVKNCTENDIRYARVPSGRETCAFCFMLSSRGFVYHTELTAMGKSGHGVHQHCDCIIVPGVEGVTKIAGYDPDAMYARWKQCAETVGADATNYSYKNRQKIMDEVATRDWRWLYSADSKYASGIHYLKSLEELTDNERKGIDRLASNGFMTIVNHEDPNAPANIDLTINGALWEMKNVGDGKHSIDDRMQDAIHKWRKLGMDEKNMKLVITCEGRTKSEQSAIDEIQRRLTSGQECLFISSNGNITRIRK